MTHDHNESASGRSESVTKDGVDRREALGRLALLSGAVAAGGLPVSAIAAPLTHGKISSHEGGYGLHGGTVLKGYVAAPAGKDRLDTVLLLHDRDGYGAATRRAASAYARAGYLVFAPDLTATFGRGATHEARVAAATALVPDLGQAMHGNGRVRVVAI